MKAGQYMHSLHNHFLYYLLRGPTGASCCAVSHFTGTHLTLCKGLPRNLSYLCLQLFG